MCVICGCGGTGALSQWKPKTAKPGKVATENFMYQPRSGAPALPKQDPQIDLHYGHGCAKVSVPGMSQERAIQLEQNVMSANQIFADSNRQTFRDQDMLVLNFVSSPGSGKTSLLCQTIVDFAKRSPARRISVIEGDQQTTHDADRIRATGAPAIQVNTGKGCHLDAQMVTEALSRLQDMASDTSPTNHGELLFIENVGNLVCPAMWDLGEFAKVAILSVTEGEDKPLKYPDMFAAASLMIINKIDLLPYLKFDLAKCYAYARQVNPDIQIIELSATSGQGMSEWLDWLEHQYVSHLRA